jgi:hypothetical protein
MIEQRTTTLRNVGHEGQQVRRLSPIDRPKPFFSTGDRPFALAAKASSSEVSERKDDEKGTGVRVMVGRTFSSEKVTRTGSAEDCQQRPGQRCPTRHSQPRQVDAKQEVLARPFHGYLRSHRRNGTMRQFLHPCSCSTPSLACHSKRTPRPDACFV